MINEDVLHVDVKKRLVIVADGMGGAKGGEIASKLAKEAMLKALSEKQPGGRRIEARIKTAVLFAHHLIKQAQKQHPEEMGGMGCTLTVACWGWKHLHICHVGDTRTYSFSSSGLKRLTTDHSVIESLVSRGHISAADATKHPLRHQLSQAAGLDEITPQLLSSPLAEPGAKTKWFIVCTDGVWDSLGDGNISGILAKSRHPGKTAQKLVNTAWLEDGRDDCTTALIKITAATVKRTAASGKEKKRT